MTGKDDFAIIKQLRDSSTARIRLPENTDHRKASPVTTATLAVHLGLSRATVVHVLNGRATQQRRGIAEALSERDMHLSLAEVPIERLDEASYVPKVVRELAVNGLLINRMPQIPQDFMERLAALPTPTIFLNVREESDSVHPDDRAGTVVAYDRAGAFVAYELAEVMAFVRAADQLCCAIPGDLSLVVFHRNTDSRLCVPLTTVTNAMSRVGREAVQMLCRKIEAPNLPLPSRRIPMDVLPGGTSAPPSKTNRIRGEIH